ncbi:hypothetical protein OESDEN_20682 [Oesophagostomum dentatum]|uniref:Uncharacterized protein n=1 Tax=Oesophagostomum dentatum TaxID=61180 RepID=A0A0B1S725_OESDE|nr:hypothetical protein OESDEN_20682 [Oesophagostomum dentatum]
MCFFRLISTASIILLRLNGFRRTRRPWRLRIRVIGVRESL